MTGKTTLKSENAFSYSSVTKPMASQAKTRVRFITETEQISSESCHHGRASERQKPKDHGSSNRENHQITKLGNPARKPSTKIETSCQMRHIKQRHEAEYGMEKIYQCVNTTDGQLRPIHHKQKIDKNLPKRTDYNEVDVNLIERQAIPEYFGEYQYQHHRKTVKGSNKMTSTQHRTSSLTQPMSSGGKKP